MRVLLLVLLAAAPLAAAQDSTAVEPLDARLFRAVYAVDAPAPAAALRAAEISSVPAIVGAAPALGAWALATGAPVQPAVRVGVSQLGAYALVVALKPTVDRQRPFRALPGVAARGRAGHASLDPYAFPSGHTALAFATATSVSLSAERWYVTVPALAWASAVGAARVWHGVHYPLDVVAGATLGAGSALLVHLLMPSDPAGGPVGDGAIVVPVVVRF